MLSMLIYSKLINHAEGRGIVPIRQWNMDEKGYLLGQCYSFIIYLLPVIHSDVNRLGYCSSVLCQTWYEGGKEDARLVKFN